MKILKPKIVILFLFVGCLGYSQANDEQQTKKFNAIDVDGNEVITIREMIKYYDGKSDKDGNPIDAKKLFYGLDANENSIVTINEFITGVDWKLAYEFVDKWDQKPKEIDKKAEVDILVEKKTERFTQIDSDKNEELTLTEFVDFHKGMINKKTGEPIKGNLKFYAQDFNNNGVITLKEFLLKPDYKSGTEKLKKLQNKKGSNNSATAGNAYVIKRIDLFYVVDTNKNFKVSADEMVAYYQGKLNNSGKPVNGKQRFYGLDTNENGSVDLEEFTIKIDFKYAAKRLRDSKKEKG